MHALRTFGVIMPRAGAAAISLLALPGLYGHGPAQDHRMEVHWPSGHFRSLQQAVDSVPEGGTLVIGPGVHRVDQSIILLKRHLTIRGFGCDELPRSELRRTATRDARRDDRFTQLVGPRPTRVVDPDTAHPMFHVVQSRVRFEHVKVTGFDVGVFLAGERDGRDASLQISESCFTENGRGVFARHPAVSITRSFFRGNLWTGVSVAPLFVTTAQLQTTLLETVIAGAGHACAVFKNTFGVLGGGLHSGCGNGAGLGAVNSQVLVTEHHFVGQKGPGMAFVNSSAVVIDSGLNGNTVAGIFGWQSQITVTDSIILNTLPIWDFDKQAFVFGDGITGILSNLTLVDNRIHNVYRAGIANFGGFMDLTGNQLWCMGFDIDGEPYQNQPFSFYDGGGNKCGCPFPPMAVCQAQSASLAPQPPTAPIE